MPLFLLDPSPIFPGRRTGQALTDIKKPWAKIRDRARLGDMRLHDFRRTFATMAARSTPGLDSFSSPYHPPQLGSPLRVAPPDSPFYDSGTEGHDGRDTQALFDMQVQLEPTNEESARECRCQALV